MVEDSRVKLDKLVGGVNVFLGTNQGGQFKVNRPEACLSFNPADRA